MNINLWVFSRHQKKIYIFHIILTEYISLKFQTKLCCLSEYSYRKQLYQYVNKHVSFACNYQGWEDCCETSPLQVPSPFVLLSICSVTPEPRGSGLATEQRESSMATSDGFPLLLPDKMAPAV